MIEKPLTERQTEIINWLRRALFLANYPPIFAVDNETLEAIEQAILIDLETKDLDPILKCGKNGLFFKGCELVLEVK